MIKKKTNNTILASCSKPLKLQTWSVESCSCCWEPPGSAPSSASPMTCTSRCFRNRHRRRIRATIKRTSHAPAFRTLWTPPTMLQWWPVPRADRRVRSDIASTRITSAPATPATWRIRCAAFQPARWPIWITRIMWPAGAVSRWPEVGTT